MRRVDLDPHPRWVDLVHGVRLQVRPMTIAVWMAARTADEVFAAASAPKEVFQAALLVAVAQRVVTDWEGVGDADGVPIRPTPEAVAALLTQSLAAFEAFVDLCIDPFLRTVAENIGLTLPESGTGQHGTPEVSHG